MAIDNNIQNKSATESIYKSHPPDLASVQTIKLPNLDFYKLLHLPCKLHDNLTHISATNNKRHEHFRNQTCFITCLPPMHCWSINFFYDFIHRSWLSLGKINIFIESKYNLSVLKTFKLLSPLRSLILTGCPILLVLNQPKLSLVNNYYLHHFR